MVRRYAVILNGKIDNICLWDGVTPWTPEAGAQVIEAGDDWGIYGRYENGVYSPAPVEPEPVPEPVEG